MTMTLDLHSRTAHELSEAVRSGETTAVDITQSYLDRIAAIDGRVKAYLDVWEDYALEQAGAIDERLAKGDDPGPLAGIPIALKDNFCTTHGTTGCASRILRNFESPYDGTVVSRLKDAGAVLLGKLNMDEFAAAVSYRCGQRGVLRAG